MMGMRLLEMEICDTLDVLHVLLEEDSVIRTPEEADSVRFVRSVIYGDMYQMENMETRITAQRRGERGSIRADGAPAASMSSKPYIPPTDPSQLQTVLGPPMG